MRTVPRVSLPREDDSPNVFLAVGDAKLLIESPTEFAAFGFRSDKVLHSKRERSLICACVKFALAT
jgi:hypothetical protein